MKMHNMKFDNIFANKKAYVAYLTAGHVSLDYTYEAALALLDSGVDILEIGVPFSDPIADGPVITQAMNQAINNTKELVNLAAVSSLISAIKQNTDKPVVLFSYLNPLLTADCNVITADAHLIVDLPYDQQTKFAKQYAPILNSSHSVALLSPSTGLSRIKMFNHTEPVFYYYVCRNGVTGVKSSLPTGFAQNMYDIKSVSNIPVVAGFGIGNKATAKQVIQYADGFVVGSALIQAITNGASPNELAQLAASIDPR